MLDDVRLERAGCAQNEGRGAWGPAACSLLGNIPFVATPFEFPPNQGLLCPLGEYFFCQCWPSDLAFV